MNLLVLQGPVDLHHSIRHRLQHEGGLPVLQTWNALVEHSQYQPTATKGSPWGTAQWAVPRQARHWPTLAVTPGSLSPDPSPPLPPPIMLRVATPGLPSVGGRR